MTTTRDRITYLNKTNIRSKDETFPRYPLLHLMRTILWISKWTDIKKTSTKAKCHKQREDKNSEFHSETTLDNQLTNMDYYSGYYIRQKLWSTLLRWFSSPRWCDYNVFEAQTSDDPQHFPRIWYSEEREQWIRETKTSTQHFYTTLCVIITSPD